MRSLLHDPMPLGGLLKGQACADNRPDPAFLDQRPDALTQGGGDLALR